MLKDLRTGKKLFVMVTHAPLNKEMHAENAHIYVEMEKRYNPDGCPSFFLGDFNARETDACSAVYRSWWTDSYHAFDANPGLRLGPDGTFNGWNLHAVPAMDRRIDFIYYRGKDITPLSYLSDATRYAGLYPSDHFPVRVDFAVR